MFVPVLVFVLQEDFSQTDYWHGGEDVCVNVESRGGKSETDRKDLFKAGKWNIIYQVDR